VFVSLIGDGFGDDAYTQDQRGQFLLELVDDW